MRITLIGSNGLLSNAIGKLADQLNFELNVLGFSPPTNHTYNNFRQIDLSTEFPYIESIIDSQIIIYCAGAGIQSELKESDQLIYHLNTFVPVTLAAKLETAGFKGTLVTFGSYFEIGANSIDKSFSEIEIVNSDRPVVNTYSNSKRLLSKFWFSYHKDLNYWHFILPTIYGPEENPKRLIPYTIVGILQNRSLTFTSGDQIRQYIHIDDVASLIFEASGKNLPKGIYSIPGRETFSVKQLVLNLFEYFNKKPDLDIFGEISRLDIQMKVLKLDGSKLIHALDLEPRISIFDSVSEYVYHLSV